MPTTYTLDLNAGLVQVLTMQDAGGKTAYLYGVTRIGEQQPGGWAYHLSDALGSVRQLVDGSAQVTLARGYMPYGEELWSLGEGSSEYGYTGEDWNTTTQMVFLRARYMQPALGMFLSRDPWSGDDLRPMTYNGWAYVEGDPVDSTDPSGDCVGCAVNSLAKVVGANAAGLGGAAFRRGPDQRFPTRYPHRLPDGTQVRIWSNVIMGSDGLQWRNVSLLNLPPVINGYVADQYLEPMFGPPPPPPPGPGDGTSGGSCTGGQWCPFGQGVGYLKGYRFTSSHNGIDLVSANDPFALAGQVWCNQTGCSYINGASPTRGQDNNGRQVVAVVDGQITFVAGTGTDYNSSLIDLTSSSNAPTYWVQYVHVSPAVKKGDCVKKGDILGSYGPYGGYGPVLHLHLSVKEDGALANPEKYLP